MSEGSRINLPHITVATVIEKNDKFLMVIEDSFGKNVYNQPAGHMECNETLLEAAVRETREETCWHVRLSHYLGTSQYRTPTGLTYVRHSFVADPLRFDETLSRDSDILDTVWLSYEEILEHEADLRSPLVKNDIDRYRTGKFFNLEMLLGFI